MSDELPELPDASRLTAGEKLVWFGPPGPQGLPGPPGQSGGPGPPGQVGSTGPAGATGSTGDPGPTGLTGLPGAAPPGPKGQDGATWLPSGSAPPILGQGNPGDYYLQSSTGVVWRKQGNPFGMPPTWVKITNLTGPSGPAGPQGVQGRVGLTGPAGAQGGTGPMGISGLGAYNIQLAQASNTSVTLTLPGPFGPYSSVVLYNPNAGQITATADTLLVGSATSLTADTGTSGAGGLDTGTQQSSTWYYVWLIYVRTASQVGPAALLLSASSTAPTLPGAYNELLLLGAVYSDASNHFRAFTQIGNRVWTVRQNVFTSQAASLANTYQSQSISTLVPPIARAAYGMQGNSVTANGTGNAIAADSSGTGEQICFVNVSTSNTALDNFFMAGNFQIPLLTAQTFWWKASTTSAANRIDITGWEY